MRQFMEMKSILRVKLLPATFERAHIRLNSLVPCNFVFFQLHLTTHQIIYKIGISERLRAFRTDIAMIHAMPRHMLSQKPWLRERLSANGANVVFNHGMREINVCIQRRFRSKTLPTIRVRAFKRLRVRVRVHVKIERVSRTKRLAARRTNERLLHRNHQRLVFLQKRRNLRDREAYQIFLGRGVVEQRPFLEETRGTRTTSEWK